MIQNVKFGLKELNCGDHENHYILTHHLTIAYTRSSWTVDGIFPPPRGNN